MQSIENAAWYRNPSWHRQSIVPALMPRSNAAWRCYPLPDLARQKNQKARNYAGFRAFHAVRCLAVPDAGSFPFNRRRWFTGDIVNDTVDAADFINDTVRNLAE